MTATFQVEIFLSAKKLERPLSILLVGKCMQIQILHVNGSFQFFRIERERESGSVERKCGIHANCQIADVTATLTTTSETILWYISEKFENY